MKELKEIGKKYDVTSNSKEKLVNKIIAFCRIQEDEKEYGDRIIGMVVDELNQEYKPEEEFMPQHDDELFNDPQPYKEELPDISEHIELIEGRLENNRWIRLKYNNCKKKCGTKYIESIVKLSGEVSNGIKSGAVRQYV